jgi:hypothetical protein
MQIPTNYTGPGIWANQSGDVPVIVTGYLGEKNGQHFFSIAESQTGIPGEQLKIPPKGDPIENTRSYLRNLIYGNPPNGIRPHDCGEWSDVIEEIERAYQAGGMDPVAKIILEFPGLAQIASTDAQKKAVFEPLTFEGLMKLPPKVWVIENIIGLGDLGMIFGEAGSGKTFVVIDLLIAAVLGEQWAGQFAVKRPLYTAYCAGEGVSGLKDRFFTAAAWRNLGPADLAKLLIYTTVPQLYVDEYQTIYQFVDEYKELKRPLDLLVIDTFHSATVNADENSARDASKVLAAMKYAIKELGCAAILVHHTNKSRSGERGSSAYRGAMDVMLEVGQEGAKRVLYCSKLKDGDKFEPQLFSLTKYADSAYPVWEGPSDRKTKATQKELMLAEMVKRPTARLTAKQWGEAIGLTQTYANNILSSLEADGKAGRALQDETKQSSNRNPWVYYLKRSSYTDHES